MPSGSSLQEATPWKKWESKSGLLWVKLYLHSWKILYHSRTIGNVSKEITSATVEETSSNPWDSVSVICGNETDKTSNSELSTEHSCFWITREICQLYKLLALITAQLPALATKLFLVPASSKNICGIKKKISPVLKEKQKKCNTRRNSEND